MSPIIINIIVAIVSILFTALVREFVSGSFPAWKAKLKSTAPKRKRHREMLAIVIKYPFFALAIFVIFELLPFDKLFVVVMCIAFLVVSYFIARDKFSNTFSNVITSLEEENLNKELSKWLNQLAKCDRADEERQEMIKNKISEINAKLKAL